MIFLVFFIQQLDWHPWKKLDMPERYRGGFTIAKSGELFVQAGQNIFMSEDLGNSWQMSSDTIPGGFNILAFDRNNILVNGRFYYNDSNFGEFWGRGGMNKPFSLEVEIPYRYSTVYEAKPGLLSLCTDMEWGFLPVYVTSIDSGKTWIQSAEAGKWAARHETWEIDGIEYSTRQRRRPYAFMPIMEDRLNYVSKDTTLTSVFSFDQPDRYRDWALAGGWNYTHSVFKHRDSLFAVYGHSDGGVLFYSPDSGKHFLKVAGMPDSLKLIRPYKDTFLAVRKKEILIRSASGWETIASFPDNITSILETPSGHFFAFSWFLTNNKINYSVYRSAPLNVRSENVRANLSKIDLSAFPNPFNPSVSIQFEIPTSSSVQLTVHDLTGRTIATLDEGFRTQGNIRKTWDATGFSSGVYVVRLQTDAGVLTKKITLLK